MYRLRSIISSIYDIAFGEHFYRLRSTCFCAYDISVEEHFYRLRSTIRSITSL